MKSEKAEVFLILITVIVIILVVAMFVLIGCAIKIEVDYGTKEGDVVDKKYKSSYSTFVYTGQTAVPIYHGEEWKLKIEKEDKELWISVDEITYHNYKIGDYYPKVD